MDITNKARIHCACRRGMRELDIAIMPFFEQDFDALDDQASGALSGCWSVMIPICLTG